MALTIKHTERGFAISEFKDRYDEKCSIQNSSLATEPCVWLGVHDPYVRQLVPNEGWKNVELPPGTSVNGRMHLTQGQAKDLIVLLQRFIDTGSIAP